MIASTAPLQLTWQSWVVASTCGVGAALFTMFTTFAIERFGGIVGGVLGTIPAAIVPASIGVAITDRDDEFDFVSTLYCVPPGVLLNTLLLILWRYLPVYLHNHLSLKQRVAILIVVSLLLWGGLAIGLGLVIQIMLDSNISIKIVGIVAIGLTALVFLFIAIFGKHIAGKGEGQMRLGFYITEAAVAGVTAAMAIILAAFNDVASGLAISFPAVLLTTLSSLSLTYSDTLAVGAAGSMIGGSISVSLYAIVVAEILPLLETASGQVAWWVVGVSALISWVICVFGVSVPVAFILRWRERKSKRALGKIVFEEEEVSEDEDSRFQFQTQFVDEDGEYRPLLPHD